MTAAQQKSAPSEHENRGELMNYFVLIYYVVEDYVTRRAPYREEHLRLAQEAHSRGELILGGALSDPAGELPHCLLNPGRSTLRLGYQSRTPP